MGLLDQLLGPVDLRKQPPMAGGRGNAPPPLPQAPSWVQGALAPGGMELPQQQPGPLPDQPAQLPDQSVRVKLGKLW